jgi:hypothetical protein
MTTQPPLQDTAAGVTAPGTRLARDATELVRASTTDLIYHHSRRVFWFASLQGRCIPEPAGQNSTTSGDEGSGSATAHAPPG